MDGAITLLAAYLHQIDPFVLDLRRYNGFLVIRWYGMAYLAGAAVGYFIIRALAKRGRTQLRPDQVGDLVLALLIGAFVGGRLGFCLLYEPRLLGIVDHFPYWGVLALWEGGMASHGGMVGCAVAGIWFAWSRGLNFLHLMDVATFAGPLGIAIGRIANFINGELYGRVCPMDSAIGVKFPQEIYTWNDKQLETLEPALQAIGISRSEWLRRVSFSREETREVLDRLVESVQSGDSKAAEAIAPLLPSRYPSQLIEAGLEGLLVWVVLAVLWTRPRKPGFLAAWWVILYAIARIAGEQFRQPDVGIGFQWLGLTRGQWLSVVMLALGVVLLVFVSRRNVPRMSGWIGEKGNDSA